MTDTVFQKFQKEIEFADWDTIARMVHTFKIEFETETEENKKLKKQIGMVKKLLYEYLQHSDDAERIIKKASFFKGLVKSIEKFEIGLDKHSAKRTDFIHFLTALMKRVEKEKLVVYKIRERKSTFKKIKEAGERE